MAPACIAVRVSTAVEMAVSWASHVLAMPGTTGSSAALKAVMAGLRVDRAYEVK